MTEIPECPFDKIAMDLITECKTSSSGNKYILTIINHLTGWLEAFLISDEVSRYHSIYIYYPVPTSPYVSHIHTVR